MGKLLRVDLTEERITEEELPDKETLRKFIGGIGLGLKLLYDETPPGVSPSDPETPLIFMTGPLTGTPLPSANNSTVVTMNFDAPFLLGRAHSHGFWGVHLKRSGYDGIIFKGAARKPVYLWVHDGQTEIRDAGRIWGKDTYETDDLVKADLKEPRAKVAAIGPAGENLCAGACIVNESHHLWSKCGVGSVMGSKKLKAVAVHGTQEIPIVDRHKLLEVAADWRKRLFQEPAWNWWLVKKGKEWTDYHFDGKPLNLLASYNLTTPIFPEHLKNVFYMVRAGRHPEIKYTPDPCFNCVIACAYKVDIGYPKRHIATMSGGGEATAGGAAIIGVSDPHQVFYLTELHNRLGFDSSAAGATLGMLYELYERGLIGKEDTEGLELNWGNTEAAITLLNKMARREGIGKWLSDGLKKAAEHLGGEAPKVVVHIKGMGINLHDWRGGPWGTLLSQIVAGAGPCWEGQGCDCWTFEPDLGQTEMRLPFSIEGDAEVVRNTANKKIWDCDCNGLCWMATWGVRGVTELSAQALACTVGWGDFTAEEGLLVGERVLNLQHLYDVTRGWTPADDLDVSPRLLEAPRAGVAKGKAFGPHLIRLVSDYYKLMGWDEKTGKPWRSTLKKLGLEEYIEDIWGTNRL